LPGQTTSRAPAAERVVPQPQPVAAMSNGAPSHDRNVSTASTASSTRAPPPPPPPAAAAPPKDPQFKALYEFVGQTSGELSLRAGEIVFITQKETNGSLTHIFNLLCDRVLTLCRMVAWPPTRRFRLRLDSGSVPRGSTRTTSAASTSTSCRTTTATSRACNRQDQRRTSRQSETNATCPTGQATCESKQTFGTRRTER
jgi:hypothetical protein